MTDLLLGLASPEFWRGCGSALVALGVIGVAGLIFLPDAKRGMQKGLALFFIATLLAGLALARFGESALLAEARERASVAELELTRLTTPRTLAPDAQQRVAARVKAFAGQEFEGQVAPGSEDAHGLWQVLDKTLAAAQWVRVPPVALPSASPRRRPARAELRRDGVRRREPRQRARHGRASTRRCADGGRHHRRGERIR